MKNLIKLIVPKSMVPHIIKFLASIKNKRSLLLRFFNQFKLSSKVKILIKNKKTLKVNLCSGDSYLKDYINIDLSPNSDIKIDLEKSSIPLPDSSTDTVVIMSAINYFDRERVYEILCDVNRILIPGGVLRIGVQDLKILAKKYLDKDKKFYFQKLENGEDRFPGETFADKFSYFYYRGHSGIKNKKHKYVFDYETVALICKKIGFKNIEQKKYLNSSIKNIKKIDNRPEMFFYLEAKKDDDQLYIITAKKLLRQKKVEESWQQIIKALDINEKSFEAFKVGFNLLYSQKRYDSALALINRYKENHHQNEFIQKKIITLKAKKIVYKNKNQINKNQRTLVNNFKLNKPQDDQFHLDQSLNWLFHAYSISKDKGVPALYEADTDIWRDSYPETTGYIIPTFLSYSKIFSKKKYKDAAIQMGDWEIRIQSPDGGTGEPNGLFNPNAIKPRNFNTGQVILGWIALYKETKNKKYLEASEKAAEYIINKIDNQGAWNFGPFNTPKSYNIRVAWPLLELYKVTQNDYYQISADKIITWVLKQSNQRGWFSNAHFSEAKNINNALSLTHLTGYTLVGLLEIMKLNNSQVDQKNIFKILDQSSLELIDLYKTNKKNKINYSGFPGLINNHWESASNWSCVTGNAQIEYFLRGFYKFSNNRELINIANKLSYELKSLQIIDKDKDANLKGGLFGSDPISGEYAKFQIPNWGVKFFADSLIQKSFHRKKLYCIG